MLIRQHERWLEELDVQLSFRASITASGAIMTISAATADLKDWMAGSARHSDTIMYRSGNSAAQPSLMSSSRSVPRLWCPHFATTAEQRSQVLAECSSAMVMSAQNRSRERARYAGECLAVRSNVAIDTFTCSTGDEVDQAVRGLNEIAAKIDG